MDYTIGESGQIGALFGQVRGLYERLKQLEDRRDRRGVRYPLAAVLMIMVLAKLSGEDEVGGIAEWAKWRAKPLAKALGLKRQSMPHRCRLRTGCAAHVMAILNNLALGLIQLMKFASIPQARRFFNARLDLALDLLLSPH